MIDRLAEVSSRNVSRETLKLLERYAELLRDEAQRQNLISASTLEALWHRHILDSAQLARFEPIPGADQSKMAGQILRTWATWKGK